MSTHPQQVTLISPLYYTIISGFWMAFLAVLGTNIVGDIFMPREHEAIENFAYPIEVPEVAATGGDAGGPAERVDIRPMILAADPEAGKAVFRKCASCHTIEPGGKNGTGPNLHNIVGDAVNDRNGFKVTESMKALGGTWDYLKLDDYLENPKRLVPKGIMSFVGLKKPKERAEVIKFLMSNTDNPPPIEAPAAAQAPAAAPAEAPAAAPAAPTQQ